MKNSWNKNDTRSASAYINRERNFKNGHNMKSRSKSFRFGKQLSWNYSQISLALKVKQSMRWTRDVRKLGAGCHASCFIGATVFFSFSCKRNLNSAGRVTGPLLDQIAV